MKYNNFIKTHQKKYKSLFIKYLKVKIICYQYVKLIK